MYYINMDIFLLQNALFYYFVVYIAHRQTNSESRPMICRHMYLNMNLLFDMHAPFNIIVFNLIIPTVASVIATCKYVIV